MFDRRWNATRFLRQRASGADVDPRPAREAATLTVWLSRRIRVWSRRTARRRTLAPVLVAVLESHESALGSWLALAETS
jgi:hypothetical protein